MPSRSGGLMEQAKPRVIVVDDDESFGTMVSEVLRDKGYEVTYLSDPKQALQEIATQAFAVAVLDLQMPGTSGLDLARHVRATSPDTQALILTGHADLDSAIEGLQHGIFDYFPKQSIRLSKLEHSVHEAVAKWRLARENRELVRRLTEASRLHEALLQVGAALAGETHVDRVLEHLMSSARELCGASLARVLLLERGNAGGFVIEVAAGDGGNAIRGARLQPGEGIAALVAETGETVRAENARAHPRYSQRGDDLSADTPGFLCAPLRHGGVLGAVMLAGSQGGGFGDEARNALTLIARQAAVSIENALHQERAVNFFTHASNLLVSVLDRLDIFEPGHSQAVAALASMVTRRMGMSEADRRTVHFAALLHDIGKLAVDPAVLKGSGAFTPELALEMRRHPALGVEILRPFSLLEGILPIIHAHHERWDGKGYPAGLAGEDIPQGARIVSVVESFDAMTRVKPYGKTRTPEEGLTELEACAGTQFDPRIVRLFVAEYRRHGDPLQGQDGS